MLLISFRKEEPTTVKRVKNWGFGKVFWLKFIIKLKRILMLNSLLDAPIEAITLPSW